MVHCTIELVFRVLDPYSFGTDPDPVWLQSFYEQKLGKNLDQKLQFTFPYGYIKDVQVTKEHFSSQKRTSSTSKHEIS
jgi:hypothetical protein